MLDSNDFVLPINEYLYMLSYIILQIEKVLKDEVCWSCINSHSRSRCFNAAGDIGPAIDLLAFLFVLGIAVGHMLGTKDGDNRVTRFGDGAVRGGWLGFLVGVIMIASSPSAAQMDFSAIMPAFAVAALTPLYGYFLKLISMQID